MIRQRLAIALLVTLGPASGASPAGEPAAKPAPPAPKPEWSPGQVVGFQLVALQFNDRPKKDAGIATTFQFASPDNRKVTRPLDHFAQIVKAPGYRELIDHRVAGFGDLVVVGEVAVQRVTVIAADGRAIEYEFRLSRDPESCCWFTDGVVPIGGEPAVDPGRIAGRAQSPSIL